jgi:hypothetical protein
MTFAHDSGGEMERVLVRKGKRKKEREREREREKESGWVSHVTVAEV